MSIDTPLLTESSVVECETSSEDTLDDLTFPPMLVWPGWPRFILLVLFFTSVGLAATIFKHDIEQLTGKLYHKRSFRKHFCCLMHLTWRLSLSFAFLISLSSTL